MQPGGLWVLRPWRGRGAGGLLRLARSARGPAQQAQCSAVPQAHRIPGRSSRSVSPSYTSTAGAPAPKAAAHIALSPPSWSCASALVGNM
jgi:hypothetical protein